MGAAFRGQGRLKPAPTADDAAGLSAALVVAAAVNRELRRRGTRRHVVRVGDDARHHEDQRVVAAYGRDRLEDVAAQYRLPPGALHVDDRAFARYRDGFLERTEPHLGIDRRGE